MPHGIQSGGEDSDGPLEQAHVTQANSFSKEDTHVGSSSAIRAFHLSSHLNRSHHYPRL